MHGAAGDDPYGEGAVEEEEKDDDGLACLDSVGRRYALSGCAGLVTSRLCFRTASVFKPALFLHRVGFLTAVAGLSRRGDQLGRTWTLLSNRTRLFSN